MGARARSGVSHLTRARAPMDDADDKYAKKPARRAVVGGFSSPPPSIGRGSRLDGGAGASSMAMMGDDGDGADGFAKPPRRVSASAHATPTRFNADDFMASSRVGGGGARLDFSRGGGDDGGDKAELVRGALDRLAFSNTVSQVQDALGSVLADASEEVTEYAAKASETLARFQAAQFASQFNPIESALHMKPTYVKVPAQTVEQLKFWENQDVTSLKMTHLQEKQVILAENAGMRALLGEDASEGVQELRETEDGVNRALLLAAVEEITNLRTRVSVLEGEAAKHKVSASGYGLAGMFSGDGASGVDQAQMQKLTRELARLEENNSRMTWMLGEKEKQIKEVRAKYTESAAYVLQEKLQECMEALEVAANLQGEQLAFLEKHALSKLESLDDQLADVQCAAESKTEHLAQLRTIMQRYFVDGDEGSVNILTSLTGFTAEEGTKLVDARRSRSFTGILSMIGQKLSPAVSAASSMIVACAPPTTNLPKTSDALKALGVDVGEDEDEEEPAKTEAPSEDASNVQDEVAKTTGETQPEPEKVKEPQPKVEVEPRRARASRVVKKSSAGFSGFEDASLKEKQQAERAKARGPLPQPKLTGRAAEREQQKRRETNARDTEGFAGFGDDPLDSDSD